jgi:16S rRNA (cytosine1402-N4)-methyltransferase
MGKYHVPVMLNECLEGLNINPEGIIVDTTFGGGGHSKEILKKLGKQGKLIAFDQDEAAKDNLPQEGERFIFIDQNFEFIQNHLQYQELIPVDGILADLGVSSHQFDTDERGFSYRFDNAVLDMRMDNTSTLNAIYILNNYTEEKLADVFFQYGELKNSRQISKQIIAARTQKNIETVNDLKTALEKFAPKFKDYKFWSQIFQALRIEVNRELEVLKSLLLQSVNVLKKDGRLVIMSYHSLEDRLVKNFINTGNFNGETEKDFYGNIIRPFNPITRKAITPSDEELGKNPRSRSAKLRIAERN